MQVTWQCISVSCKSNVCQAAELIPSFAARMLQVIIANDEHFGSTRVQHAQQQQAWLADLQAGLLSGNCFQRFLSQRCGANSQVNQICGHQAFAQPVSAMIRYLSSLHGCPSNLHRSGTKQCQSEYHDGSAQEPAHNLVCKCEKHWRYLTARWIKKHALMLFRLVLTVSTSKSSSLPQVSYHRF